MGHGFDPWRGKITDAMEQLICNYSAHELQLTTACLRTNAQQQEKPLQWESHTLQRERSPCSPQLEKARGQQSITRKT